MYKIHHFFLSLQKQKKKLLKRKYLGSLNSEDSISNVRKNKKKDLFWISEKDSVYNKGIFKDFFLENQSKSLICNYRFINKNSKRMHGFLPFFQFSSSKNFSSIKEEKFFINFGFNFKDLYSFSDRNFFFEEDSYFLNKVKGKKRFFLYNSFKSCSYMSKSQSLRFIDFKGFMNYSILLKEKNLFSDYSLFKKHFLVEGCLSKNNNEFLLSNLNTSLIFR